MFSDDLSLVTYYYSLFLSQLSFLILKPFLIGFSLSKMADHVANAKEPMMIEEGNVKPDQGRPQSCIYKVLNSQALGQSYIKPGLEMPKNTE